MSEGQRRELQEALLDADRFEDLPGKRQAAILAAKQNRPKLRAASPAADPGRPCEMYGAGRLCGVLLVR